MSEKNRIGDEHESWREQATAYMLGSLDRDDVEAFEAHAEGCETCRSEMRWLRPAVEALPESVPLMKPPAELRARLLDEVGADARAADAVAEVEESDRLTLGAWLRRLRSGRFGWRPLAGVAAVALVIVAFAGYEIGSGGSSAGSAPKVTTLVAPKPVEGIDAKVVTNGKEASVQLANVKQLPDDRVLEAWVIRRGEVEPVRALFVPDKKGRATTTISDMSGVETVMVTREPKGGSQAPTSSPIATVPIRST